MHNKKQNLSWVKLEKYCELNGYTRNAVFKRIEDNSCKPKLQYKKNAGVYWIHLQGVGQW